MMPDLDAQTGIDPKSPDAQAPVIAFLSDPHSYGRETGSVERRETHGALIFLVNGEAYKIKRNVRYSYMDFSSLQLRRRAIEREFEINKKSAPEIYLGVIPVTRDTSGSLSFSGQGETVEWVLHMRRFNEADLLSERTQTSPLEAPFCRILADAIHRLHENATVAHGADSYGQMIAIAQDVAAALETCPALPAADVALFAGKVDMEAHAARALLNLRSMQGRVRRCHGDLHLANIVLWNGEPVLFDAIEFDEDLATIDTLYDLAFLLMDLLHRNHIASANIILNRYLWRSQRNIDYRGLSALPLFLSLRAGVRAMVAAQRSRLVPLDRQAEVLNAARSYLRVALASLERTPPRLIAIGGLSGTGKSTLGAALAPGAGQAPGAIHLRSDLERKALFGAGETERLPKSAYDDAVTKKVYEKLLATAELIIQAGVSVIVDAVYSRPEERFAVESLAARCNVPFTGLWLEAPSSTLKARVDARKGDASDATSTIVEQQLTYDVGSMSWNVIDASGAQTLTYARAMAILKGEGKAS